MVQKTVAVKQCFSRQGFIRIIRSWLRDTLSSEGGFSWKSGFGRSLVFCGYDNDGIEGCSNAIGGNIKGIGNGGMVIRCNIFPPECSKKCEENDSFSGIKSPWWWSEKSGQQMHIGEKEEYPQQIIKLAMNKGIRGKRLQNLVVAQIADYWNEKNGSIYPNEIRIAPSTIPNAMIRIHAQQPRSFAIMFHVYWERGSFHCSCIPSWREGTSLCFAKQAPLSSNISDVWLVYKFHPSFRGIQITADGGEAARYWAVFINTIPKWFPPGSPLSAANATTMER